MKQRGALLGSNSSRNSRQGKTPMKGLPYSTAFLSSGFAFRCLEKPNDEFVVTFATHSIVVAEHSLQVGEVTINAICGIRDAHFYIVILRKQQRQIALDAQVCAT